MHGSYGVHQYVFYNGINYDNIGSTSTNCGTLSLLVLQGTHPYGSILSFVICSPTYLFKHPAQKISNF